MSYCIIVSPRYPAAPTRGLALKFQKGLINIFPQKHRINN